MREEGFYWVKLGGDRPVVALYNTGSRNWSAPHWAGMNETPAARILNPGDATMDGWKPMTAREALVAVALGLALAGMCVVLIKTTSGFTAVWIVLALCPVVLGLAGWPIIVRAFRFK